MRRGSKALLGSRVVTVVLTAKDGRVWIKVDSEAVTDANGRHEDGDSFICRRWQLSPV